ncbi:hypothetical protein ESCO_002610 [Escovopsis weberi]|uniref:N-acetyltransferase domain-containing protein n=1 Tax=Escovopsis weberi TaxID=150374 RepID=A0A0N0RT52_ESCWE|nr:hypothetical protein ESCO_002610 [Escovopsis weberi]
MTVSVPASPASSTTAVSAGSRKAANGNDAPLDSTKHSLDVLIPDASAAKDASLVLAIVRLINAVFLEAEAGIWDKGACRTSADEVAQMLQGGQLVLGFLGAGSTTAPLAPSADESLYYKNPKGQQLVGCIYVKQQSPTTGFLGMLALDERYQGLGLARHLMAFAEKRCLELGCSSAGLDLLYPTAFIHPRKARMNAWYLRLGYEIIRVSKFEEDYPEHAPLLAGPAELRIFEKRLC